MTNAITILEKFNQRHLLHVPAGIVLFVHYIDPDIVENFNLWVKRINSKLFEVRPSYDIWISLNELHVVTVRRAIPGAVPRLFLYAHEDTYDDTLVKLPKDMKKLLWYMSGIILHSDEVVVQYPNKTFGYIVPKSWISACQDKPVKWLDK